MTPVHSNTESLLKSINNLDTATLETFAQAVNLLLAKRKAPALDTQETSLLSKINEALPPTSSLVFERLQAKSKTRLLSTEEQLELEHLSTQIERQEAARLEALLQLAQLRGLSVQSLRNSLGIKGKAV